MITFSKEKQGYAIEQVDDQIGQIRLNYEEQEKKRESLNNQVDSLNDELIEKKAELIKAKQEEMERHRASLIQARLHRDKIKEEISKRSLELDEIRVQYDELIGLSQELEADKHISDEIKGSIQTDGDEIKEELNDIDKIQSFFITAKVKAEDYKKEQYKIVEDEMSDIQEKCDVIINEAREEAADIEKERKEEYMSAIYDARGKFLDSTRQFENERQDKLFATQKLVDDALELKERAMEEANRIISESERKQTIIENKGRIMSEKVLPIESDNSKVIGKAFELIEEQLKKTVDSLDGIISEVRQ
ncbi:MAG: hypothetical protein ACK5LL_03485 [Suipraeoptans sp.]